VRVFASRDDFSQPVGRGSANETPEAKRMFTALIQKLNAEADR
jgi:hypothetical protein